MRTKKIDKQFDYAHRPAQTKQQVNQCIARTLLMHGWTMGKHEFIGFIAART